MDGIRASSSVYEHSSDIRSVLLIIHSSQNSHTRPACRALATTSSSAFAPIGTERFGKHLEALCLICISTTSHGQPDRTFSARQILRQGIHYHRKGRGLRRLG